MKDELLPLLREWADLATRQSIQNNRFFTQENGLSFSQMNSLIYISCHEPVSMNSLSNHLGVSNAAVSQLVARLVENGLVNRKEDPEDRRSKILTLTQSGQAKVTEAKQARLNWIPDLVKSLSPEQEAQVAETMKVLVQKIKEINTLENLKVEK